MSDQTVSSTQAPSFSTPANIPIALPGNNSASLAEKWQQEDMKYAEKYGAELSNKGSSTQQVYEQDNVSPEIAAPPPASLNPTEAEAQPLSYTDFEDKFRFRTKVDLKAFYAMANQLSLAQLAEKIEEERKERLRKLKEQQPDLYLKYTKPTTPPPKGNGEDKTAEYPSEGLIPPPIELKRNQALPKARPPIPLVTIQDKQRLERYYLEDRLFKPNNLQFSSHQARIEFINLLIKVKELPVYQRIINHQRVLLHPDIIAEEIKYRTTKIPAGNLTLVEVTKGWLVTKLDAVQPAYTVDRKGATVKIDFPERWIPIYFDNPEAWTVPTIHRIMTAPYITEAGNIVDQNGYNPETGYYLHYSGEPILVPEEPTGAEIKASLARLKGLLSYYPFTKDDGASLSVVLSLLISPLLRSVVSNFPLHIIDSNSAGTGKSLLVDTASILLTGHSAPSVSLCTDDGEFERQLGSMLMHSPQMINIDNIHRRLESPFLCTSLTQEHGGTRVIGSSKMTPSLYGTMVAATGNNVQIGGDVPRRSLKCRLQTLKAHPELEAFPFNPKILAYEERSALITSILTLVKAYYNAGQPRPAKLALLGSFEDWDTWVRGLLIWLGEGDPVQTMLGMKLDDPQRQAFEALLTAWYNLYSSHPISIKGLLETLEGANKADSKVIKLKEALMDFMGVVATNKLDSLTVSRSLREKREGIQGDYMLRVSDTKPGNKTQWYVEKLGTK